jgi:tetratricopeptide (TPR) repeat protein
MAVKSKTVCVVLIAAGCCAAVLIGVPFLGDYLYEASIRGTWQWYLTEGNVHSRRGEYDAAIEDYTSLIEEAPDFAGGYDLRGQAYAKKGEYDAAIEDYTKSIELYPGHAEAYALRGDAYARKGRCDAAWRYYTKAIELDPSRAYGGRGAVWLMMMATDPAIKDLTKAIELGSQDARVYKDRAFLHWFYRDYEKAWADVNECERLGGKVDPEFLAELRKASGREE